MDCEYLQDGLCRAVSEFAGGAGLREEACKNSSKNACCYICREQESCEISCDYPSGKEGVATPKQDLDSEIQKVRKGIERVRVQMTLGISFTGCLLISAVLAISFLYILGNSLIVLRVPNPSMEPTLYLGDVIGVRTDVQITDIIAEHWTGDIIVFEKPGTSSELIVHRAVESFDMILRTKGDANLSMDDWLITADELVGKVVEANSLPLIVYGSSLYWIAGLGLLIVISIVTYQKTSQKGRRNQKSRVIGMKD